MMRTEMSFSPLDREVFERARADVPKELDNDEQQLAFMATRAKAAMAFLRELADALTAAGHSARIVLDGYDHEFEHPGDCNAINFDDPSSSLRFILASLQELDAQIELYPRFGIRWLTTDCYPDELFIQNRKP